MLKRHMIILLIVLLLSASGCVTPTNSVNDERRDDVETLMDRTESFMQDENESKIKNFFSQDYYGGYDTIERRIERTWQTEQVLDLQFYVNRILEQDGLFNVQVRWNKTFLDAQGVTRKTSGISEMILVPHRESFRILNVTGDHLF